MKALLFSCLLGGACAIPSGPIALSDQLNPTARSPEFAPLPSSANETDRVLEATADCFNIGTHGCMHGYCGDSATTRACAHEKACECTNPMTTCTQCCDGFKLQDGACVAA
mmetsp:Transcript_16790/g.55084  ORF Transcript_16790/g.55084 Transcript_16790/m.55084 type:complete len:111 (-) Transcript_16790:622-954(-)